MCFWSERYGFASGSIYIYMQSLTWKVCVCLAPASEVVFEIVSYMFLTNLQNTFCPFLEVATL